MTPFFVPAADARLRCLRIPGETEPPLVFLHEGLGNIALWRDFPERLCRETGRSGLIYERRGYGGSDPPPSTWPLDYLDAESRVYLPAVLDGCGIDRAVLIGHSDGGTVALIAAADRPDRVAGVVTEAAHIFVEPITLAGIRRAVDAYDAGRLREKLSRHHGDRADGIFRRWSNTWLSPEFRDWNIVGRLSRITRPVLIIQGENDEYGSPDQVTGIRDGASGPTETALIPDCGHIPHLQAPEATLNRMADFIRRLGD